ncbi:hypothetical protein [Nocardioides xinjiangensis]|uniref:hypothetical protein n=1 Tax=Nocardioides xinjiangensis TaxID=2817376 RepID=UPI001B30945D|nr:hypothetical protein [Nocardioides sp. SYSU D00778]
MHVPTRLRRAVAVVCATALATSPLLVAPTTAGAASAATPTARAAMPHLTATLTKKTIRVKGADRLRAGRVHFAVKGAGIVEFVTFDKGYDVADFTRDVNRFGAKNDMKALKRAIRNATIIGGFAGGGSGTIVFPRPGAYTPFAIGQRGVVTGKTLVVRGPVRSSSAPRTDGRILAKRGLAWGGASTLPANGRFLFKNKRSAAVPHFVVLQQVAAGTTTDQVLQFLQSGEEGPPPSWVLPGSMETGSLSPGRSMTVDYDLPPGQYVVMCFFPDPEMQGMPHALMGMLRMINLT